MRFSSFKQLVGVLPLSIIVVLLLVVAMVTPVSAMSTKGTGLATNSAKTITVAPTDIKIKSVPVRRATSAYDSCWYPLEELSYEYVCITYQSNFGYCRYEWDWDYVAEQWLGPYSSFVPIGSGTQQSAC